MLKRSVVFLPSFVDSRSLFLFFVLVLADQHIAPGLFCNSRNNRKLNNFVVFRGLKNILTVKIYEFFKQIFKAI